MAKTHFHFHFLFHFVFFEIFGCFNLEKKSTFKKEDLEMIIFNKTKKGETQA